MRLLLDTHVLLWWRADSSLLSSRARLEISDPENQILVSVASLWEVAIKRATGKLEFSDDFETVLREEGFDLLPIVFQHLRALDRQPPHHRDPFDRLLIAQAAVERVPIITRDPAFTAYGMPLVW